MWSVIPSDRWDWAALRDMISKNGIRNSLLVAPMPTTSTSQILGNNECFEPYTSNIYSRRVLRYVLQGNKIAPQSYVSGILHRLYHWSCVFSGEFVVVNKHLLHDLTDMGLWSPTLKNKIIHENGSIINIREIPDDLKAIYRYRTSLFFYGPH